jgi:hypothetical protein
MKREMKMAMEPRVFGRTGLEVGVIGPGTEFLLAAPQFITIFDGSRTDFH